ncbi:hypothetical protein [Oceanobacter mangrovi]|uniref:hypothetical protein n=1 Tax=Oceanobacter mangrovi TaxID=2862510 RepID=UPI001C8D43E3|nr:hypothetical protein [Oceanobacter mangrovi]
MLQLNEIANTGVTVTRPCNIWAMAKHQSIRHLLLLLEERLGGAFLVDQRIETDCRAIYICELQDPSMRAYLYTLGQTDGRYGVHLEYPDSSEANQIFDAYENQSLESLVHILAVHLDVDEVLPLPVMH